jgi:aryl-alcohol dehydrogenase-like predicted oxidoreductase
MEKRQMGNTDMKVTPLGFGGAEIGSSDFANVERLLGSALDAGLNVIDTAECYGDSEELIGKAVSHRRDDYYLFSKCGHNGVDDLPDWDPKMLELSIDRSLKLLRTDYLDLIQLHSCSEELLRQGDVIEVLQRAKEAGKVRYIGYSGDRNDALFAVQSGAFDTLQTSLNIAEQEPIDLTLPIAREKNMGVIAKRPIANACWKTGEKPESTYHHTYWERLQQLNYQFLDEPLNKSIEIALRFTIFQPGVHTAIVGTANPDRWEQNAKLVEEGPLSSEELELIRLRWKEIADKSWVGQT